GPGAPTATGPSLRQVLRARVSLLNDDELTDESVRLASAVSAAQAELAMVLGEVERRRLRRCRVALALRREHDPHQIPHPGRRRHRQRHPPGAALVVPELSHRNPA
ncbi:MAG: hypothetical protein ACO307_17410, partial [Ilumatobacteraceae bacterium]